MINLLDLDAAGLAALFADRGEKPFRAKQVSRWVHQRFVDDIDAMTDLSRAAARVGWREVAAIRGPTVIGDTTAADGTRKWLLDVGNGNAVESVYIPEDDRGTLCISSQAGCALDCAFCSTGKQGFNRNLTTGEIVGQLWHANRALLADGVTALVGRAGPRADHQRRDDGHGRAARQLRQRRAGAAADARRQRVRTVAPPRHAVDVRPRAGDRSPARRLPGRARRLAARGQRPAARPPRADQPQVSARASSWRRACAISTARRAIS